MYIIYLSIFFTFIYSLILITHSYYFIYLRVRISRIIRDPNVIVYSLDITVRRRICRLNIYVLSEIYLFWLTSMCNSVVYLQLLLHVERCVTSKSRLFRHVTSPAWNVTQTSLDKHIKSEKQELMSDRLFKCK